jgi:hypothetical protein
LTKFQRHRTYLMADNDEDVFSDLDSRSARGRRKMGENERKLNAAVAAVAERARSPHVDPTIVVRHIEPWSLRERPSDWRPRRVR